MSDLHFEVEFRSWESEPALDRQFQVTGYLDNSNSRDFGNGATLKEAFLDCLTQIEHRLREKAKDEDGD